MKKITLKEYKQLFLKFLKKKNAYNQFEYHYNRQKKENKEEKNLLDTVINSFGAYYLIAMLTPISRTPYTNPNYWDKMSEEWMNYISLYEIAQSLDINHNVKTFKITHKYPVVHYAK